MRQNIYFLCKITSLSLFLLLMMHFCTSAQKPIKSFELRTFVDDSSANGITDFKGETEYFDTNERIQFLKDYADYSTHYFNDLRLDSEIVTNEEAKRKAGTIKAQPLPRVRQRMALKNWKWIGHKEGQKEESAQNIRRWEKEKGVTLDEEHLKWTSTKQVTWNFPSQSWRFSLRWRVKAPKSKEDLTFILSDKGQITAATVGLGANGKIFFTTTNNQRIEKSSWTPEKWHTFKLEFDLAAEKRGRDRASYNLYLDGLLLADYIPLQAVDSFFVEGEKKARIFNSIGMVNRIEIKAQSGAQIDDLQGIGYHLTGRESYPYTVETFLDENFDKLPSISDWQRQSYDDDLWDLGKLPIALGGERHTGEALYLRKEIKVKDFQRAVLHIETLDPGGALWINGEKIKEITNRHPVALDITSYLKKNRTNLLAIKVNPFYLTKEIGVMIPHTYLDYNIGWFAGRVHLDLTAPTTIDDFFISTKTIERNNAQLQMGFHIDHQSTDSFSGKAIIKVYPWFPKEETFFIASDTLSIKTSQPNKSFSTIVNVPDPKPWTPDQPNLYKVEITLLDQNGRAIDDEVKTTGIRTLSQDGGNFRLNGKTTMLNGSLMFGLRSPLEKMMTWRRSAPLYQYAKDFLAVKKMNGNAMRIHIHDWMFPSANINDPRLAELADQMGIMLIWATPAWIRVGLNWQQLDFKGYPQYMKQVRNHPSIVMWELANHIQSFSSLDEKEANRYVKKAYQTVYPIDSSRLISYVSYIHHFTYSNDKGTIDRQGNPITPAQEWTAPQVTRGNQITIFGYGKNWDVLRKWPDDYHRSMLNSKERAYFNFEHEESIGQPNWNLVKGKPWYHLHSYEWDYDIGSIGRHLHFQEWRESQAWQAFSAWESMKKQMLWGIDGLLWMGLRGGANSVTYEKPLMDFEGHAKLVYWINKMIFQQTVAGSDNEDVVYGPEDVITPLILHNGPKETINLTVLVKSLDGQVIARKNYKNIQLGEGRTHQKLPSWKPQEVTSGTYAIEYILE